jgi:hypothetical protein
MGDVIVLRADQERSSKKRIWGHFLNEIGNLQGQRRGRGGNECSREVHSEATFRL